MLLTENRKIDKKGRVALPAALLKKSNIKIGDSVYFEITKTKSIVIRKDESEG